MAGITPYLNELKSWGLPENCLGAGEMLRTGALED